ncbi:MAG: SDR family NAD(P)-dependent oxidoreductase [Pseudomonadales bacterium]
MGRLSNKLAVVVGAGQTPGQTIGNGRATALRFAQEGANVVCVDRDMASAEETVAMIHADGGRAWAMCTDITSEAQCEELVQTVQTDHGALHVLHNNVGIGAGDTGATSMPLETWNRILNVNLTGIMQVCKHALPVMRAQGHGVITNISSVAALASVGLVAYKTSKAALNAYTHALAMGNARYGIRANVIMPGLMNTPMAIEGNVDAGADRDTLIEQRNRMVPLGRRMGTAWDVANAALFLASDEAGFITGINLPVDGGQAAKIG